MRRIVCAALLSVSACATMPPVPAVPPWNELNGSTVSIDDDERRLWSRAKEVRAKFEEDDLFVTDEALTAYLDTLLAALIVEPLPPQIPKPAVYVIRSSVRIGISFPDGAILITTSMLAAIENEAQLAALLGHELGHFMARHRLVQTRFAKTSRSTVERMQLSRENETYCDRYALDAMRRSGYDPRELPKMLQLSEPEEGEWQSWTESFRSHPFTEERIRDLRTAIGVAPGEMLRVDAVRYDHAVVGVLPVAADVELKAGLLDRAQTSIARLLALNPESGRGYYLKGEHARLTEKEGRRSTSARGAYQRAVELAPDDPEAVRALGFLYYGDDNVAGATPLLEKYLKLVPDASDRKLIERYLGRNGP